jgi:hypothetical protein
MFKRALLAVVAAMMLVTPAMANPTATESPDPTIVLPGEPKPIFLLLAQYWGNNDDPFKRMEEERQYREKQEKERADQQRQYDQQQRDYESQQRQYKLDQIQRDIQYGNPSSWQLEQYKRDMQDLEFKRNSSGAGRTYDPSPNNQEWTERNRADQLQRDLETKKQQVQSQEEAERYRHQPSYPSDSTPTYPSTTQRSTPQTQKQESFGSTEFVPGDVVTIKVIVNQQRRRSFSHKVTSTDTAATISEDFARQINSPQGSIVGVSAKIEKDGGLILVPQGSWIRITAELTNDHAGSAKPAGTPQTSGTPESTPQSAPQATGAAKTDTQTKSDSQSSPSTSQSQPTSKDKPDASASEKKDSKKAKKQKRSLAKKVFGGLGKVFRRHSDE